MNEMESMLAAMGGGAGAAVILTGIIRGTLKLPDRFVPISAVFAGFLVSLLILWGAGEFTPVVWTRAIFAGLAAVGAWETATRVQKTRQRPRTKGSFRPSLRMAKRPGRST